MSSSTFAGATFYIRRGSGRWEVNHVVQKAVPLGSAGRTYVTQLGRGGRTRQVTGQCDDTNRTALQNALLNLTVSNLVDNTGESVKCMVDPEAGLRWKNLGPDWWEFETVFLEQP